jgi:protein tyrosine/serine phosphatase
MWRMGQPPSDAAWRELAARIDPTNSKNVVVVKLDDETEGSDDYAEKILGWEVVRIPIPPEDDKPWSVFVLPAVADVHRAEQIIIVAHAAGKIVVHHCVHGRDRTSFLRARIGMVMSGWSKAYAWQDMIAHGFRWELPDLDAYWLEDVPSTPGG